MGYAIARTAEMRGAQVTLIAGPNSLSDPQNIDLLRVQTAREMAEAVFERQSSAHLIIKAAAVSDYSPIKPAARKIKKVKKDMTLSLERNPDILKELGRRKKGQVLVGFAAETEKLEANATKKLAAKNLDMIVGNLVGKSGSGFAADTNRVKFFYKNGGKESLPAMEKDAVADILLDRIVEKFFQTAQQP
jgi:phosphopantothenoylcysteine decarboxylase/phosphopantothenate--cysteine ligase